MELNSKIEAILFFKNEPVKMVWLSKIFEVDEEEIASALEYLEEKLEDRGIRLLRKDSEVMLGSAPEVSELIKNIRKDDLSKSLGRAGLETLAIIIYSGPVTRSRIDYIRGVNSSFIIRNLLVRGLIEKIANHNDQRSFLYRSTFDLLSYLGISKIEDLPEYYKINEEIKSFDNKEDDDIE